MSLLNPNIIWVDRYGKEFRIVDVKDNTVWYAHKDVVYSCRTEAFQERFQPRENNT